MPTTTLPQRRSHHDPGHTVLAVPVPELDPFVRARTAHYDAAYLAVDPCFGQAHVTVLGPWVRSPTGTDLALVAEVAGTTVPFSYRLARWGTFPNGIIHLLAEPAAPFAAVTEALVERFPRHPPYGGAFAELVPHVTLDAVGPGVDEAGVATMLGDRVPVSARAQRLQLQWWQAGHCHVQQEWRLGTAGGER